MNDCVVTVIDGFHKPLKTSDHLPITFKGPNNCDDRVRTTCAGERETAVQEAGKQTCLSLPTGTSMNDPSPLTLPMLLDAVSLA